MPVRFTSPSLGENPSPQLKKHQWQVDVAYRHLHASQWFVGTEVRESAAPFQQPLYLNIDSFDITANYGISDRIALAFTLPFSRGSAFERESRLRIGCKNADRRQRRERCSDARERNAIQHTSRPVS